MKDEQLLEEAKKVREMAYAPYSHFLVGAALLTKSGKVFTGCNIENASFSATNCAERTAIFSAITVGEYDFSKIAIVGGGEAIDFCPPCGICRQVMMEFCDPKEFEILLSGPENTYRKYTLEKLYPLGFKNFV